MASTALYPPIVDSYMPAFVGGESANCKVYFSLSKFNSSAEVSSVHATVVKQSTGMNVVSLTNTTEYYIDSKTGQKMQIIVGKTTGIILNLKPQKVEGKDNLYFINIPGSYLSTQDGSYKGWIPGWIYKIQIRLSKVDYNESGGQNQQAAWLNAHASDFSEWSTICIVKATGKIDYQIPVLEIDTLNANINKDNESEKELQSTTLDISGKFIREEDPSELIHSYTFTLYDNDDNIVETSNEIYANQYQDSDSFNYLFKTELENGKYYKLAFKYETINKYVNGFYQFDDEKDDRVEFLCTFYGTELPPCDLITVENDDDGIFKGLELHSHSEMDSNDSPSWEEQEESEENSEESNEETLVVYSSIYDEEEEGRVALKFYSKDDVTWSGNLCIRRSDSRTDFKEWTDIYIYVCRQQNINAIPVIYDYTIESGVFYKYGVQTIDRLGNRGAFVNITKNAVIRNFNYTFLLGKNNQQLKLKFDNAMNSFKYQLYDSKVDPIGAKYPVIARNANVYYRTFPINGLISFWMDDNKLFINNKKDIYKYEDVVDNYNSYNIKHNIMSNNYNYISQYDYIYERDFRNKVLEFLQDGEFKLFKSPTEGNIIVRLIDINCTPNQTLSRMIYSFSATAYEMAEPTMENYFKYGFYTVDNWESTFEIGITRLGQISMDIPIETNTSDGTTPSNRTRNIFDIIKEKYDTRGQNVGGYTTILSNIHHIKITFDDKPMRIQNSKGDYVMGNNFIINDVPITVYSSTLVNNSIILSYAPIRMYEFDERLSYPIDTSYLYLYGAAPETDGSYKVNSIHVTIDFLYEATVDTYIGKKIRSVKNRKALGQFFKECAPEENIFREIYNKYYYEWPYNFCRLDNLSSIDIEANYGAAFAIQDSSTDESNPETHIVGATGRLELYEISNIKALKYLGIYNFETKEIEEKNTDVLINYLYVIRVGDYEKKELQG